MHIAGSVNMRAMPTPRQQKMWECVLGSPFLMASQDISQPNSQPSNTHGAREPFELISASLTQADQLAKYACVGKDLSQWPLFPVSKPLRAVPFCITRTPQDAARCRKTQQSTPIFI